MPSDSEDSFSLLLCVSINERKEGNIVRWYDIEVREGMKSVYEEMNPPGSRLGVREGMSLQQVEIAGHNGRCGT
jgi:hypothetical protein